VNDPNAGRWLTPDPMGGDLTNPQSLNRYAYALNNPETLTDPLGTNPNAVCLEANRGAVMRTTITSCGWSGAGAFGGGGGFGGGFGGYESIDGGVDVPIGLFGGGFGGANLGGGESTGAQVVGGLGNTITLMLPGSSVTSNEPGYPAETSYEPPSFYTINLPPLAPLVGVVSPWLPPARYLQNAARNKPLGPDPTTYRATPDLNQNPVKALEESGDKEWEAIAEWMAALARGNILPDIPIVIASPCAINAHMYPGACGVPAQPGAEY
jgi:hypothetical protein